MIELLIVVAIIGIISAIGIPSVTGILENIKEKSAQTSLQSIYLAEAEYKSINKQYYIPVGNCGDQTKVINTNLFDGEIVLENNNYRFCISGSASDYTATAYRVKAGGTNFTIKDNKEKNF
jgi:type II secretory pathway pseudopilin PulG